MTTERTPRASMTRDEWQKIAALLQARFSNEALLNLARAVERAAKAQGMALDEDQFSAVMRNLCAGLVSDDEPDRSS